MPTSFIAANHSAPLPVKRWAELQRISLSHFYKLRREGLGPDELEIGTGTRRGRKLITPESTSKWLMAMAARSAPAWRQPKEIFISESRRLLPGGTPGALEYVVSSSRTTRDGTVITAFVAGPFKTLKLARAALDGLANGDRHV